MPKAVIFDFDGVIVDTEPLHYRAFQSILEPMGLGYSWDAYVERYMGFDDRDAFVEAFREGVRELPQPELDRLIAAKAARFQEVIAGSASPYPGVVELVTALSAQIPLALCSGALRCDIDPILDQLSLDRSFSVIVTADDVAASKPDPASYSLAVQRLVAAFPEKEIVPSLCVAIEDTPAGIASARGAGIPVLAVTNSYPASHLSGAQRIVPSLAGLAIADFSLLASSRG